MNTFIVIDGMDGAGKGVQSRRLRDALQTANLPVLLTREPGGSSGAEEIRRLLVEGEPNKWDAMTELLLMYAARRSHLQQTILPALAAGTWVISDRFADSSRAFQGIAGELGLATVEAIHQLTVGDFKPALTLILDLPVDISLQRAKQRGGGEDRFERKGVDYHQRVRAAFLQLAQGQADYQVIDATQAIEAVTAQIFNAVKARFGLTLC